MSRIGGTLDAGFLTTGLNFRIYVLDWHIAFYPILLTEG